MNGNLSENDSPAAKQVPAFVADELHATSNWVTILAIGAVIEVILLAFSLMDSSLTLPEDVKREGGALYYCVHGAQIAGLLLTSWASCRLIAYIIAIWKVHRVASMGEVENAFRRQNRLWKALAITAVYKLLVSAASSPFVVGKTVEEVNRDKQWQAEIEKARNRTRP